jgi:hypothetical protein
LAKWRQVNYSRTDHSLECVVGAMGCSPESVP